MRDLKTMNERFLDWGNGGGIFSQILTHVISFRPEWLNTIEHAKSLDRMYHGNHSADKVESTLSYTLFENFGENAFEYISQDIIQRYEWSWNKLYATLNFEYNPIFNIEGTETRTITYVTDDVINKDIESDINETDSGTVTNEVKSDVTDNFVYGFNSSTESPNSKSSNTGEQEQTTGNTHIGTNSESESVSDKKNQTTTDVFTRGGNIGVTMTQEMIEAERDVSLWNFYTQVFKDIDMVLTSPIWC